MLSLFSYQLSFSTLAILMLIAFFIGMAKTGVHGVSMFAIPLLALIFGGKASSGLMLPMLIIADIFAVKYYHRHANWSYLRKLFPWSALGVVLGTFIGNSVDDQAFREIMGAIVFISIGIMIWMEKTNKKQIPDFTWFAILMGLLGGITSMVGNAAFAIMAIYLLSMRLPKNEYIATSAWFFLMINLFKVPFHVFSWNTITLNSFLLNLTSIPFIFLGAYLGIVIVKKVSDTQYRWFIIGMTSIASLFLFI
jgi:uncharacterized membrane protein YfcA